MPESNFNQTSMRELVRDAESQIESLTRALETLKSTVRRLSAQVAMGDGGASAGGSGYGFGKPAVTETPTPVEEKPFDFSAAASALARDLGEPEPPAISHQRPNTPQQPAARQESEWYGVSDGGSWPVGPKHGGAPKEEPSASLEPTQDITPDGAEAVAAPEEPVAAAGNPEWDFDPPAAPEASEPVSATDAASGENQAPASATDDEPKRSLSSGWPDEGIWSQSFDWPAMRGGAVNPPAAGGEEAPKDDFRSMVDQVRAEIEAARASGETMDLDLPGEEESEDDEARRAEVQRMVEEMRARANGDGLDEDDGAFGDVQDSEPAAPSLGDDEAKREEARRAVEQMKAELAGAGGVSFGPPSKPAPSLDWSHMQAETSGPPVLVVKDTDGRVELANVYDLLNRLECGESAALLNYTPHSVTVGLPVQAPAPGLEAVESAVKAVFGRTGVVDTDGARITVQMGTDAKKKRSEDAA